MPPKSAHSQPVTSGAQQSRFGRTLKVTERAKDGLVAEEVKKRVAREAKGKQREVATQIESQPQPERDDSLVVGDLQKWREPTPTGNQVVDHEVRTAARVKWLTRALIFRDGQDVREKVSSGTLKLKELEDLFASDGNTSTLKESANTIGKASGVTNVHVHDKVHHLKTSVTKSAGNASYQVASTSRKRPHSDGPSPPLAVAQDNTTTPFMPNKVTRTDSSDVKSRLTLQYPNPTPERTPAPTRRFKFKPSPRITTQKPKPTSTTNSIAIRKSDSKGTLGLPSIEAIESTSMIAGSSAKTRPTARNASPPAHSGLVQGAGSGSQTAGASSSKAHTDKRAPSAGAPQTTSSNKRRVRSPAKLPSTARSSYVTGKPSSKGITATPSRPTIPTTKSKPGKGPQPLGQRAPKSLPRALPSGSRSVSRDKVLTKRAPVSQPVKRVLQQMPQPQLASDDDSDDDAEQSMRVRDDPFAERDDENGDGDDDELIEDDELGDLDDDLEEPGSEPEREVPPTKAQDHNKPVLRLFHPYEHRQLVRAVASRVVARVIADGTYMDTLMSDDDHEDGLSSFEQYVTEEWRAQCRRRPLRRQYALEAVHIKYIRGLVTSWRARVKSRILELLRSKFGLGKKPKATRKIVKGLLPHAFHSASGKSNEHGLFKGKLIKEFIRLAIFSNEKDYGPRFDDIFQPDPAHVGLIAFVVTIANHSIRLFETGYYRPRSLRVSTQAPVFNKYRNKLLGLAAECPTRFHNIQAKIYEHCRAALPKREPARAPSPPASAHEWTTDSEEEYIVGTDQSSDDEDGADHVSGGLGSEGNDIDTYMEDRDTDGDEGDVTRELGEGESGDESEDEREGGRGGEDGDDESDEEMYSGDGSE